MVIFPKKLFATEGTEKNAKDFWFCSCIQLTRELTVKPLRFLCALCGEMVVLKIYFDLGRFSNAAGMAEVGSRLAPASFMRAR